MRSTCVAIALITVAGTATAGVSLPVTEDFETGANGWLTGNFMSLTEVASGGSDGGAYVSTTADFSGNSEGEFVTLFRGEQNPGLPGASNGAFVGDWVASGATEFAFDIRHNNQTGPLTVWARFSPIQRFPGGIAVNFVPVLAGQWTTVTIAIDPNNPQFVSFEGFGFDDIFPAMSNIQFGIDTPASLAGSSLPVTFDIDNVRLIPTPASAALLGFAGLAARRRRG
ncbi:MAG: hypothetical protein AAGG07_08805 [Planctomycetota bacterium]